MTPDRWQAIGELFDQALAAPTGERTALIDRVSGTDEEVRREVRSLLASHNAAPGGFVQKRIHVALESFQRTSTAASTPARVGPYRLVRELGRGGMGAVFLAERDDDEYRAKVAVKLVRPGMDTEFILSRFRRERQTLARLQHPNISRLLDGGTTDHGLPYIVMEYIDGPWITTYAAQHKLGVEARIRLFLAVCSAVDYAHRNFIVHRDLKPSNILVDAAGVPKLLDFGICKLLVETVTANDTVAPLLTPRYASPEQIRGEAATTSSDIYSLGAVLYELLTGISPRRFENLTPLAIQRALESPIVRPSAAVGEHAPRAPARRRRGQHPLASSRRRARAPIRVGRATCRRFAPTPGPRAGPGQAADVRLSRRHLRAPPSRLNSGRRGGRCDPDGRAGRVFVRSPTRRRSRAANPLARFPARVRRSRCRARPSRVDTGAPDDRSNRRPLSR